MNDPCTLLAWDSEHWGFPVARINGNKLNQGVAEDVVRWCEKHQVKCLYFAADGTSAETLQVSQNNGFCFVDVRVDMEVAVSSIFLTSQTNGKCREARLKDLFAIERLAKTAHEDTRFFKDSKFDQQKAADLYGLWIRREFRENKVFVAGLPSNPNRVLGYASASVADGKVGRIGLVAVCPAARGCGLGHLLVENAMAWCQSHGASCIRVVTQGTNIAALRLYESCGFKVAEVKVWFHRWFELKTTRR